jgi:hypothetical protein
MMEIVAAIDMRETEVQASLVFVVSRAVFGEDPLAVRPDDRVQVRPVISGSVLRDERLGQAFAVNRDRAGLFVDLRLERVSGGGLNQA